jgi:hypothetical protein
VCKLSPVVTSVTWALARHTTSPSARPAPDQTINSASSLCTIRLPRMMQATQAVHWTTPSTSNQLTIDRRQGPRYAARKPREVLGHRMRHRRECHVPGPMKHPLEQVGAASTQPDTDAEISSERSVLLWDLEISAQGLTSTMRYGI